MFEENKCVTFEQLRDKYNCSITKRFNNINEETTITATTNQPPFHRVNLHLTNEEACDWKDSGRFEQMVCDYFDKELFKLIEQDSASTKRSNLVMNAIS